MGLILINKLNPFIQTYVAWVGFSFLYFQFCDVITWVIIHKKPNLATS